jgi:hypothetical protein
VNRLPVIPIQKQLPTELKEVLKIIRGLGFIAGSCARYYASNLSDEVKYNDIDIFSYSEKDFDEIIFRLEKNKWIRKKESPNAIQFEKEFRKSKPAKSKSKSKSPLIREVHIVEVVKPFKNEWMQTYGKPKDVLEQFDFTVVKAYFLNEKYIYVDEHFVMDNEKRRLVITHINCPLAVAQRVVKYGRKGYNIGIREMMKLFIEWENRPREYRERLLELLKKDLTDEEFEELERLLRID